MKLKENIENVIIKIPKEKYRNIFKGAYERPENIYQRIKHGKLRRIIYKFHFKTGVSCEAANEKRCKC